MTPLVMRIGINTIIVEETQLTVTRIYNRAETIRHKYDGTVSGFAKAIHAVANLEEDDFKLFASISRCDNGEFNA